MASVVVLLAVCCSAMLSIMSSLFNRKNIEFENAEYIYNFIVSLGAFGSWFVLFLLFFDIDFGVLKYSVLYGICYSITFIALSKAIEHGTVSLTAFINQLSLIGVAVWGFIFWNNSIKATIIIGILFLIVSLYLCLNPSHTGQKKKQITPRWLFFCCVLFVANAGCSIVQKYQQLEYAGNYGIFFMLCGAGFSVIISSLLLMKKMRNHTEQKVKISKKSMVYPFIGGVSSAILNFSILRLMAFGISESIFFPTIAVGGLIITTLFSSKICKEKLMMNQWVGLGIGMIALIFLNI